MNKKIDINTDEMNKIIERQRSVNERMMNLFKKIKDNTEGLKDSWDTKTSAAVFEDFNNIYKLFDGINNSNDSYTKFLENVVATNYSNTDKNISSVIDKEISIQ